VETGEIVIAADRFRLRYRFPVAAQADPAPAAALPAEPAPAEPVPALAVPAGDGQPAAATARPGGAAGSA
jgi:hypothetical protein